MRITLNIGNHETKRTVKALPQRNENGYGGLGYGGSCLFVAWVADCFDPPMYLIRADNFDDAHDVALASLAPIVTEQDLGRPIADFCEGEWADETGIAWAPDGELVWSEALQMVQISGPIA